MPEWHGWQGACGHGRGWLERAEAGMHAGQGLPKELEWVAGLGPVVSAAGWKVGCCKASATAAAAGEGLAVGGAARGRPQRRGWATRYRCKGTSCTARRCLLRTCCATPAQNR